MDNGNLSEFRNDWLKEIEERNEQISSTTTVTTASTGSRTRTGSTSTSHSSSGCAKDSGLEAGDCSKQITKTSPHQRSAHNAGAEDCYQLEGNQRHPLAVPVPNEAQEAQVNQVNEFDCLSEASATYYPFRILTTLLNHASADEEPECTRKGSGVWLAKKTSLAVTRKKGYFLASSDSKGEGVTTKKMKKDDMKRDQDKRGTESKGYLDLFIADLNEISEIPFFDVSLPREVAIKIFWYLDSTDLCRCAQVSKSWRSLAEDELLWCDICHKLGFETDALTVEHSNWKSRVRQYVVIRQTLELNWKGRIGKLHNLHHAKGGVLCAAHSHNSTIVSGYSNCQTKLWKVVSGETCVFQPSSTALIIDELEEEGTISNEVVLVATCDTVTAAAYSQGFVDVWSNEEGTEAVYTFSCPGRGRQQPSSLHLWENTHTVHLALGCGHQVQVHTVGKGQGKVKDTWGFDSVVKHTAWLQDSRNSASSLHTPTLAMATNSTVSVAALYDRQVGHSCDMVEIHNIIDAPVLCMDARLHPEQVVVGFTINTGPAQYFRVNVYDVMTRKADLTLTGHTACVLCVNVAHSPPHQLVTGSRDRKVRVFDTRAARCPLMTLIGHAAAVTTVQMDERKVVSGDEGGFVCVWDQRMASKLWELNNRHPVRYCHFEERQLTIAHVPYVKQHYNTLDFDTGLHQRHRGSLHVYDFLADQTRQGVPEICLSTYDEPQGYNYNIALATPYD